MVAALWVPTVPDRLALEAELLEVELLEVERELEVELLEVERELEPEPELGLWLALPPHPDAAMTTTASRTDAGAHFPIMLSRSETGTASRAGFQVAR